MEDIQVRINKDVFTGEYKIYILRRVNGNVFLKRTDGEVKIDLSRFNSDCTLSLTDKEMTLLVTELQSMGVRPKEQSKVEGLYEAQSEHLKDLRQFLKLK